MKWRNISSRYAELCLCIQDGILKLQDGAFSQYIPHLDWNKVNSHVALPISCRHLLEARSSHERTGELRVKSDVTVSDILDMVLGLLDISREDFDFKLPLTSYGLDSIGAAKIAAVLRPYTSVSQMQLLGDITWDQVQSRIVVPYSLEDIGPSKDDISNNDGESKSYNIILSSLGVTEDEFAPDIPLSAFGLDSIGASKLSRSLRPYVAVTQMQLLGQTTWSEIQSRIRNSSTAPQVNGFAHTEDTIIELFTAPGIPLIIIHDIGGSWKSLVPLQANFASPLWALQLTPSAPLNSDLRTLVSFYEAKIREKRPNGPYRLATFSASSVIGIALAKSLEESGEEVVQMAFVDHYPALWTCGAYDYTGVTTEHVPEAFVESGIDTIINLLRDDYSTGRGAFADELLLALRNPQDPGTTIRAKKAVDTFTALTKLIIRFLASFQPSGESDMNNFSFVQPFMSWFESIRAPISLYVASGGILRTLPPDLRDKWSDLGRNRGSRIKKVSVKVVEAGHFSILGDGGLASGLQSWGDVE